MARQHWNTQKLINQLDEALEYAAVLDTNEPGGRHDTEEIYIERGEATARVFGVSDAEPVDDVSDADVDVVHATYCSRYGMDNADRPDCDLVRDVVLALEELGFTTTQAGWKGDW